jgi:hypothetical protein
VDDVDDADGLLWRQLMSGELHPHGCPVGFFDSVKGLSLRFVCPVCGRAHEEADLGSSFTCVSCERGLPTPDRPNCPDCTTARDLVVPATSTPEINS